MSGLLNIGSRAASVRNCRKKKPAHNGSVTNTSRTSSPQHSAGSVTGLGVINNLSASNNKFSIDVPTENARQLRSASFCAGSSFENNPQGLKLRHPQNLCSTKNAFHYKNNKLLVPDDHIGTAFSAPTSPSKFSLSVCERKHFICDIKPGTTGKSSQNIFSKNIPVSLKASPRQTFLDNFQLEEHHEGTNNSNRSNIHGSDYTLHDNFDNFSTSSSFIYSTSTRFRRNSLTPSTATASFSRDTSSSSLEEHQDGKFSPASTIEDSTNSFTSSLGQPDTFHQVHARAGHMYMVYNARSISYSLLISNY